MPDWDFSGPNPITNYVIGIGVAQPLAQEALRAVSAQHQRFKFDFPRRNEPSAFTFQVGQSATMAPTVMPSIGGVIFDRINPDGTIGTSLSVLPNQISYMVSSYKRWKEYWAVSERIFETLFRVLPRDMLISYFYLHAANRFTRGQVTADIDVSDLIEEDSPLIAPNLVRCRDIAHSFHGFQASEAAPQGSRIDNIQVAVIRNPEEKVVVDLTFNLRRSLDAPTTLLDLESAKMLTIEAAFERLHIRNNELFRELTKHNIWSNIDGLRV